MAFFKSRENMLMLFEKETRLHSAHHFTCSKIRHVGVYNTRDQHNFRVMPSQTKIISLFFISLFAFKINPALNFF